MFDDDAMQWFNEASQRFFKVIFGFSKLYETSTTFVKPLDSSKLFLKLYEIFETFVKLYECYRKFSEVILSLKKRTNETNIINRVIQSRRVRMTTIVHKISYRECNRR